MRARIDHNTVDPGRTVRIHAEGVGFVPVNFALLELEASIVNTLPRETILKWYIDMVKDLYDFTPIDYRPSIGVTTISVLVVVNSI